MKRVLLVSYDLVRPGQNYEELLKRIKAYSVWARLGGSAYLVITDAEPVTVRDYLAPVLDPNDKIYIGVVIAPAAWQGLPDDVTTWLRANLK